MKNGFPTFVNRKWALYTINTIRRGNKKKQNPKQKYDRILTVNSAMRRYVLVFNLYLYCRAEYEQLQHLTNSIQFASIRRTRYAYEYTSVSIILIHNHMLVYSYTRRQQPRLRLRIRIRIRAKIHERSVKTLTRDI